MCGEHRQPHESTQHHWGSSPHVRGALWTGEGSTDSVGIIPACAGSTGFSCNCFPQHRDHPRMCGEHICCAKVGMPDTGSSPHVRGALQLDIELRRVGGIIPACAGSTGVQAFRQVEIGDHPRMCGEHVPRRIPAVAHRGSSPHVRGARPVGRSSCRGVGIIPACAGSTSWPRRTSSACGDHPRMCGEHTMRNFPYLRDEGSSPHVRGAQ